MNHLKNEKSPYLLQHRNQPVDWYPWGDEAFTKAKTENKPVLLSIGYSTCHWCHVMAHESFENEDIAQKLNDHFVGIKLDREERPDIDSIYMRVCQGLTGSGGWPLTILMTPDQTPFFAATYLPPEAFHSLLTKVSETWQSDPDSLRSTGRQIADWLAQTEARTATYQDEIPSEGLWKQAIHWYKHNYDNVWGGFGAAPKFPSAHSLLFLLRAEREKVDTGCLSMVRRTLEAMAQGGLYDHLGGGFARYSTDEKWLVPHFEKTLYDNALLAMAYSEAGYHEIACETLDYVLRELTSPEGGFFCGQDADSEGEEGKFYLWTEEEINRVLGDEKGERFCQIYQIHPSGIPNRIGQPWPAEMPLKEAMPLQKARQTLLDYRKKRYTLGLDDKILTSWNGLMIAAMTQVGLQQNRVDYIMAAERAAGFIQAHLSKTSGRLWHRFRDGEAAHEGQLSDYAYYAYGLIQLYKATQKAEYLLQAVQTARWMELLFADAKSDGDECAIQGGFFETAKDSEALIARLKDLDDGAMPSGNSVAALVLIELAQLTAERCFREGAARQTSFLRRAAAQMPAGHTFFLYALLIQKFRNRELLCVAAEDDFIAPQVDDGMCVMVKTGANARVLGEAAPFTKSYPIAEEGVMYYLCEGGVCQLPSRSLPVKVRRPE